MHDRERKEWKRQFDTLRQLARPQSQNVSPHRVPKHVQFSLCFGCFVFCVTQATHLENVHGMNVQDCRAAGADVRPPGEHLRISRVERSHVALAEEGGELSTRCLQCSKDFARKSALDHFIRKAHGLDPDDVKCWVVVADGRAVRKGRLHQMKLTTVLAKRSLPERGRL